MGCTLRAVCHDCGWSRTFTLGVGLLYEPEALLNPYGECFLPTLVHDVDVKQALKKVLERELVRPGLRLVSYGHGIARCDGCRRLTERFFFRLEYDGGSFEPDYRCKKCDGRLSLWQPPEDPAQDGFVHCDQTDLSSLPCPRCGRPTLKHDAEYVLYWD